MNTRVHPTPRTALAVALLALAALAGCDAVEIEDPNEPKERERSLKVAHAAGETRVPAQAARVVALSAGALDASLALGLKPVGASTQPGGGLPAYLAPRARGIEPTGSYRKPFFNAVEFVGPDLILGDKKQQGRFYGRLNAIASTIMTEDSGHSWEVNTRLYGEALARTDRAEALLVRYDARARRAARSLDRLGDAEVSVVRVLPGRVVALGERSFAGTMVGDAGLGRPRAQRRQREAIPASGARTAVLNGDLLLLSVAPGGEGTAAALQRSGAWQRLPPVRAGKVLRVPDEVWGAGSGVLAAEAALRDLQRLPG